MDLSPELLARLESRVGDAFFVLDLQKFEASFRAFLGAFRDFYPRSRIAYSYKTNYLPPVCRKVDELGGYADVASRLEYDLALRAGVAPERIVFNGPLKTADDLTGALLAGAIVNLDSPYEVEIVRRIAAKHPDADLPYGLRCNIDFGSGAVSRFGFDVENGDLEKAVEDLARQPNCRLRGLQCHSSKPRSAESYARRADAMLSLTARLFGTRIPEYVDLGGGFYSSVPPSLRPHFPEPIPMFREYAAAVGEKFARAFPSGDGPELILEPGVALAADSLRFACRVVDVKTVRGRRVALTTGSVYNVNPTLHRMPLQFRVVPMTERIERPLPGSVDLVGYTCMENDCLFSGYRGPVERGDYVAFDNVGAYTLVLAPTFIQPRPPVVALDPVTGGFEILRRRETVDDLCALDSGERSA